MGNNPEGSKRRGDVSTFMVHLTRNTDDCKSAKENLIDILCTRVIQPRNSKGLFYATEGVSDAARTVCFAETPFNAVKHLIGKHQGRGVELSPYGLVFSKDLLIQKGANPVFYVNTYANQERKEVILQAIKQLDPHKQKEIKFISPYMNLEEIFGRMVLSWEESRYGSYREHFETT